MFNPHMHHHQQQQHHHQQQQFHQHLRQIQQLFQQQVQPPPPPPPPQPAAHHVPLPHQHQPPRAMPVPPQAAPPARMVNLCQTSQTTIIGPNPMLQGAILMQQMQGNMRGFGMGGQQFRQFFAAGARSSLLGPVPMGVAIKSPMMGFPPPARPVYPHVRYYNNNNNNSFPGSSSAIVNATDVAAAHQSERKRELEQIKHNAIEDQPGPSSATEASAADNTANPNNGVGSVLLLEEQLEEPEIKKQKTHGLDVAAEQTVVSIEKNDAIILASDTESQPGDAGSIVGAEILESDNEGTEVPCPIPFLEGPHFVAPLVEEAVEEAMEEDVLLPAENQEEEDVEEGNNKFYCYLCSITCLNQQSFRSHMNSISHQQRMMEIQHMSNACLVTLLPRLQDTLQGTNKDGEKKKESKRWCATCRSHFTDSSLNHRQTKEHKLARKMTTSSCTVCKKHFRSSQIFIQHLQTPEHRKKVEMVQDNQSCEEQSKIPDGFLVEEVEESGASKEDENIINALDPEESEEQDGEASREVTLDQMDDGVQHDPEVVYGSRFFVPVAGFICKLCNKFYHFESPDLHSHCKSSEHFENLKRYKTDQKCDSSRTCAAESDLNMDLSTPAAELSSKQPFVVLSQPQEQEAGPQEQEAELQEQEAEPQEQEAEPQQQEKGAESVEAVSGALTASADLEQSCVEENLESVVSEPAVTTSVSEEGNPPEKATKSNSKAKAPRRRTVRASNRR